MLKHLKIYYLFVSLPFIMLLCGAAFFWGPIMSTIARNPHPQINYTIWGIMIFGGLLIIYNSTRLMREAKVLRAFSRAIHAKTDATTLKEMANGYDGEIACLLQMMANSADRSISHQEQAALEHEVENVYSRINKRNSLPSYLTGLLVGMGLLGTFIGLLSTLGDIGALIGSFSDLDMSAADPIVVFSNMIEKMKAPMASMAIAFSASLFGLLGSIIMGLMMVGIRRFQGDINAVLNSEVARHVEIALSFESISFRGGESAIGCYEAPTDLTSKVLLRIEERLAEAARIRQWALSAVIDDFKTQRADMLRALNEQAEANNSFSSALQQLTAQLGTIFNRMEQKHSEISGQVSELTVALAGDARETHHLLAGQITEQKRLIETLNAYNIDERLSESARAQQRTLNAVVDDFRQQREEMLQTLATQNEASRAFRGELQSLGAQLAAIFESMESGSKELSSQISELTVNAGADAKEAQRLMSINGNSMRTELQKLGSQLAGRLGELNSSLDQGATEICNRVDGMKQQLATDNEKSIERLDEAGDNMRSELQLLGKQLATIFQSLEKGSGDMANKLSELMHHRSSDARAAQELLSRLLSVQMARLPEEQEAPQVS